MVLFLFLFVDYILFASSWAAESLSLSLQGRRLNSPVRSNQNALKHPSFLVVVAFARGWRWTEPLDPCVAFPNSPCRGTRLAVLPL
jgi:hypothetical protein